MLEVNVSVRLQGGFAVYMTVRLIDSLVVGRSMASRPSASGWSDWMGDRLDRNRVQSANLT